MADDEIFSALRARENDAADGNNRERLMREHDIHRVLVGTDGELVGIVSTLDLMRTVR